MTEIILQYEKDFFSKAFCYVRGNLENRLSNDFIEYGKSGRVYDRESTINALHGLPEDRNIEITQFSLTVLSESILLARYVSHHRDDNSHALRTSIWKLEDNIWKLFFHQGTTQSNAYF